MANGEHERTVGFVAADPLVAAALQAGLVGLGWSGARLLAVSDLPAFLRGTRRATGLVLVADARGRLPEPRSARPMYLPTVVVAVGPLTALPAMAVAVDRGIVTHVLDADQPVANLVRALDRMLREAVAAVPRGELSERLRARDREARLFAALTGREQGVLAELLAGRSAAEIAARERVSLATVRSHIRAVLTKLGVSSQLAATALAHRSCREPRIVERMRQVHQF